jgi:hypothetical protein
MHWDQKHTQPLIQASSEKALEGWSTLDNELLGFFVK